MERANPVEKKAKAWADMSRQEKRAAKIYLPGAGKAVPAMELIKVVGKNLPAAVISGTTQKVDHEKELRKAFMENGADGINYYVKKITGAFAEKHKALVEENERLMAEDAKKQNEPDNS